MKQKPKKMVFIGASCTVEEKAVWSELFPNMSDAIRKLLASAAAQRADKARKELRNK